MSSNRETFSWSGNVFEVYDLDKAHLLEGASLYAFARQESNYLGTLLWQLLYVGQSARVNVRVATHEKWPEVQRMGMTHIHFLSEPNQTEMNYIEDRLIEKYHPPLNLRR